MRWDERRERFRRILNGQRCVVPASVYDPLSVRIAADLRFELGMFAGSTAALTVLGEPDLVRLTLTEFAGQALRISRASDLPILVDADHGYGNALNVQRTVEELEIAGIAGMSLEDTLLPRAFGSSVDRLIPIDEAVGKIKAALAARSDPRFAIFARTTLAMADLPEIVDRVSAYQAAGADGIFIAGAPGREALTELARHLTIPLVISPKPDDMSLDELARLGVRVCLQGHLPIRAAIQAVHETLKALRDGAPPASLRNVASRSLVDEVTRKAAHDADEKAYLGLRRNGG